VLARRWIWAFDTEERDSFEGRKVGEPVLLGLEGWLATVVVGGKIIGCLYGFLVRGFPD